MEGQFVVVTSPLAYYEINKLHVIFSIASGVGLSPLYCGHFWPIVPALDDRRG
jgi:hypothetical protein